jgi:simple sugar transport system permease protein
VYASILTIIAAYLFVFRTRRGLELQGMGERPEAAHARGIPVNRMRYVYAAVGGALVGIAGAAYSLDVKLGWSYRHTAGLGWIALAIVIFGGWHPVRVAFGAYLFGALQVVALKLQPVLPNLSQVLSILPFPLMIFTLLLVSSDSIGRLLDRWPAVRGVLRSEPPSALGTHFEQE